MKLKTVFFGFGWVAQNRHIKAAKADGRYQITAVFDRTLDAAKSKAAKLGVPVAESIERVHESTAFKEADVCVIAAPPDQHMSLIELALKNNKSVLSEKPLVTSREDLDRLKNLRAAHSQPFGVVHNFQFARSAECLWNDLEAGHLGNPVSIEGIQYSNPRRRLPVWYEDLPLGLFYDECPHLLYLLLRASKAKIQHIQSFATPSDRGSGTPKLLTTHFRGIGMAPARLTMNFTSSLSEWFFIIWGTERVGIVDLFRDIYICLPNDGQHVASTILRTTGKGIGQHLLGYFRPGLKQLLGRNLYGNDRLFTHFADAVEAGRDPDLFGFQAAAEVCELQLRIVENCDPPRAENSSP